MEAQSEKEVFDELVLVWKEVTERDGFDAVIGSEKGESALQLRELNYKALRQENQDHSWIK